MLPNGWGEARLIEVKRTAGGTAAVVGQGLDVLVGKPLEEGRVAVMAGRDDMAEADVPAVAVVGVIAGEKVQERVDGHVVNVALASRDDLEPGPVGPDPNDPSAEKLVGRAVLAFGLDETVITDSDVDVAIDPEPDPVGRVVGPAELEVEADALDEDLGLVGNAVIVGVGEGGEGRRVEDVERLVVPDHASGAVHRREDVELVGLAVVVGIDTADDATSVRLGVERAILVDPDVDFSRGSRRQAGRVTHVRRRGRRRRARTRPGP